MSEEGQLYDKKSLRVLQDGERGLRELAADCVAMANASGGRLAIGVEDAATLPPPGQRVTDEQVMRLNKRIPTFTLNVAVAATRQVADNGAEWIELQVFASRQAVAATSDGRYYLRVGDESRPLMPEDLARLAGDKSAFVWEAQPQRQVPRTRVDVDKLRAFVQGVRASQRVSERVKHKTDNELLDHYLMADAKHLTNLGVLWVGLRPDRAVLRHAPVIQCIRVDDRGQKVFKRVWDDYSLNPQELIDAVWREVPDWQDSYEFPDGLFRKNVPHFDEVVVRELLANALVHRPYTQGGDIFINLFPDRLEVHNPGLLPLGVTAANILHTSRKRNDHLAQVFYDLKLMEREGSGYDRLYEQLLASGRPGPKVEEGDDRVTVTVQRRIAHPEVIDLISKADSSYQLQPRERTALGMIAQEESMTATQLAKALALRNADELRPWLGRLLDFGLVLAQGRTKGTTYRVNPDVLKTTQYRGRTSLRGIERHRLRELVLSDLGIYGLSKRGDIHARIGTEIPERTLRTELAAMVRDGVLKPVGEGGGRRYELTRQG
jgi:ATP-dependent DNA helicase RecG